MLRWLVWILAFWWLSRLVGRLLRAGGARRDLPARAPDGEEGPDLSRLSRQEISDADYEEIPPRPR